MSRFPRSVQEVLDEIAPGSSVDSLWDGTDRFVISRPNRTPVFLSGRELDASCASSLEDFKDSLRRVLE